MAPRSHPSSAPRIGRKGFAVVVLVWVAYTLAYAVAVSIFGEVPLALALSNQILASSICAALSVPVWLLVVRGLDGRPGRQILAHGVLLPAYAVGSTALLGAAYAARGAEGGVEAIRDQFGWISVGAAMLYLAQFAAYHALAASQRANQQRQALDEARALAREQELRSLHAQLNPHFLFNSLTAISAEVRHDPDEAREMIGQLSDLLRYSLDSGRRDLVALREEVAFVRDYLALEAARMGDRLVATVEVDGRALEADVPPMSVQTLVENAVRHGIAPLREGGHVSVTATVRGGSVEVSVRDTGVGTSASAIEAADGIGIANTDERLRLLLGSALEVDTSGPGLTVRFRVPLPEPSAARSVLEVA